MIEWRRGKMKQGREGGVDLGSTPMCLDPRPIPSPLPSPLYPVVLHQQIKGDLFWQSWLAEKPTATAPNHRMQQVLCWHSCVKAEQLDLGNLTLTKTELWVS